MKMSIHFLVHGGHFKFFSIWGLSLRIYFCWFLMKFGNTLNNVISNPGLHTLKSIQPAIYYWITWNY